MPKPGDYAVCFGCGAIMEFDKDLRCFIPEPQDLVAYLMRDEGAAKMLLAMQQSIFQRNKRPTHH